MPDFVVITDLKGKILFANHSFLQRTGYREDELIGQPVSILQSPSNPPGYGRALHEASLHGGWAGELLDVTKDGQEFRIYLTSTAIFDANGKTLGAVGISREVTDVQGIDNSLRATQEFLVALLENTPAPIYVMSADDRFLLVNQAWEKFVGKRREDILGCKLKDVFPEDAARRFRDTNLAVFNTGKPVIAESRVDRADGTYFFHTAKFPLRDAKGNVEAVAGVSFDITKMKRVELALAHEYDLLQALMSQIPDTIYFKDTASRFTRINPAQARMLGVADPKQAVGKTDADFFTPEFAREALADEQAILASGKTLVNKVEKVTRLDGQTRWVSATKAPIFDKQGQITGLVGVSREIPEQKVAAGGAPPEASAKKPTTILLVEDDENLREFQSQVLAAEGFNVITARDGEEGLQRYRASAQDIGVILTDITMPRMSGDTMIAEIRKLSDSVKIIVVSGFARGDAVAQLHGHQITAVIDKPYSPRILLGEVRRALDIPAKPDA